MKLPTRRTAMVRQARLLALADWAQWRNGPTSAGYPPYVRQGTMNRTEWKAYQKAWKELNADA